MVAVSRSFASRTLAGLRERWRERGDRQVGEEEALRVSDSLERAEDRAAVRSLMEECVLARGGEVSARVRARRLAATWLGLNATGRLRFLQLLASDFGVDSEKVRRLAAELVDAPKGEARKIERRLRGSLAASRRGLVRQLAGVPSGMKLVVDMRADLLEQIGSAGGSVDQELRELDLDMLDLLTDWFDVGFLELRRISWDTPASILEKVIAYEAVHRIDSWADLRNRLDSDRRCYGFFHPRMPDEPLIFVEIALASGIASSVQELLDLDAPQSLAGSADTAVFYSISNAQAGLRGVGFGDSLIKRVVDDLQRELPGLQKFVTLSPIPGLRRWFNATSDSEVARLSGLVVEDVTTLRSRLADLKELPNEDLRTEVLRVTAAYLLRVKRGEHPDDPVARFHLGNGARVERLNWRGDSSAKGIAESFGVMVNYRYEQRHIEANHEAFATDHLVVAAKGVSELLEPPPKRR